MKPAVRYESRHLQLAQSELQLDTGEVGDEAAPNAAELRDAQRLHTNHYIVPAHTPFNTGLWIDDSVPRLARLRALVQSEWGQIDVPKLKEFLADHGGDCPDGGCICRHGRHNSYSVCGYIAEPAAGILHVRRGSGCTGTWTAYRV